MTVTVWRRLIRERRVAVVVVLVLTVLAIALWSVAVYPLRNRVIAVRGRAEAARTALLEAEHELARAQAESEAASIAEGELAQFYESVLPQGLAAARAITYQRLAALARAHRLVMARRSATEVDTENGRLVGLESTMALEGRWADMRRFLHALESAEDFIVVEDIMLSRSEGLGTPLALTLSVVTYFPRPEVS